MATILLDTVALEKDHVHKLGYNQAEAVAFIGSDSVLKEMIAAGWIKPVIKRHKLTLYSLGSLEMAFDRLIKGEYPRVEEGV